MFPHILLQNAQNSSVTVEVRSGQKFTGTLLNKDHFMNMNLKDVTITNPDGQMYKAATTFLRGTQIKYVQIVPEVAQQSIDQHLENTANAASNYHSTNTNDRDRTRPYNKSNYQGNKPHGSNKPYHSNYNKDSSVNTNQSNQNTGENKTWSNTNSSSDNRGGYHNRGGRGGRGGYKGGDRQPKQQQSQNQPPAQ